MQPKLDLDGGKYTFVFRNGDTPAHVLRHGQPWLTDLLNVPGANCWLAAMHELAEARETLQRLLDGGFLDEWLSLDQLPENMPVLARYHPWNNPEAQVACHVVWKFRGEIRPFPATDGKAYAKDWQPLRGIGSK